MPKGHPEHSLQVMINKFVRAFVPQPHFFFAVDRSKRTGQFTHVREKARGLVSGTPDTILAYPGLPMVTVELKAPGNEPTDTQFRVGTTILAACHHWDWCDTVVGYAMILVTIGVPLLPGWEFAAANSDAVLDGSAIKREEAKTGRVSKKRYAEPKPTPAQLRKVAAVRARFAAVGGRIWCATRPERSASARLGSARSTDARSSRSPHPQVRRMLFGFSKREATAQ